MDWFSLATGSRYLPDSPGIYVVRHKVSGKEYVGLSQNVRRRSYAHKHARTDNNLLHRAVKKYGPEQFDIAFIRSAADMDSLSELEVSAIAERQTRSPQGYNIRRGGSQDYQPITQRESERRAEAARKLHTGKKRSAETRARLSASLKGFRLNPEQLARMAASHRGMKMLSVTRKAINAAIEKPVWIWSAEAMTPTEYPTIKLAMAATGIPRASIQRYLKEDRPGKWGWVFVYAPK